MFEFMKFIFEDRITDTFSFKPFSLCHILYLLIIIAAIIMTVIFCKNKDKVVKEKIINVVLNTALCLYVADFFIMPLAMGHIQIIKLPFHLCTLMSIMCFLSRHTKFFSKYKNSFTILGMIGALMYLTYPAGVNNSQGDFFDGYTYRIIQTVLYHGLMVAQGVFAIAFGEIELKWKNFKYDIISVLGLTVLAMLANSIYTGEVYEQCECVDGCTEMILVYDLEPNWFFVQHDALYAFPNDTDGYYAPFMMIGAIIGMCALVRVISQELLKRFKVQEKKEEVVKLLN